MTPPSIADHAPEALLNWTCMDAFKAAPIERIAVAKSGLPARWVKLALGDFMLGCGRELSTLKLSQRGIGRMAAIGARLSVGRSECALGIAVLIGQIETMVRASGEPAEFNASNWFAQWVTSPLPALSGERPIEYLDTWDGRVVLSRLLAQMQSSAYV
ncbi:MbcA/ParS/Xre antitoxin family protein [Caulobacter sp. FWC2]|uniref:MbcA/ParS/Xre antitoxin family protein n=1 Tax=Caulobacter sp. FWC2 TaxID=69664 RepID=UPI000C154F45|nr:MbcA/ParS/Xre antitoxin family protein [Caulobacter sp. FWC2]PIB92291.1 hypothetical protein CSW62_12355 [Caulobacter sp. FWC2]